MNNRVDTTQLILIAGEFTPWAGQDSANYALADYLASTLNISLGVVSYWVAPPLSTHRNVSLNLCPKPLNSHFLGEIAVEHLTHRVIAKNPGACIILNGGVAALAAINWVHYVHSAWPKNPTETAPVSIAGSLRHRWYCHREKKAFAVSSQLIANSNMTKGHLLAQGIPDTKISVVYYGVDKNRFHPYDPTQREMARNAFAIPKDSFIACFIGGLGNDDRKGFQLLYEAWKEVIRLSKRQVILTVAGSGPQLNYWKTRVEMDSLSRYFRFTGHTKTIETVLKASDILVSPARYEAYGIAIQEALCTGIPAIISPQCGIGERYPASMRSLMVSRESGMGAWANAILNVSQSYSQEALMDFSSLLRARSWNHMAEDIVKLTPIHQSNVEGF